MSEAQTDSHPVVGTHLAGLLGGSHPACRSCGHVHRITAIPPSKATCDDVTYDAACPQCPCTANGDAYDHGVVDITPNFDDHHFRLELAAGVGGGAVERFDIDEYPDWSCIRIHESGDRYNAPTAPSGAYGILFTTWTSLGLSGQPWQSPPSTQDQAALELYGRYGWSPWSSRFSCGL